jgi:hypothetical protein
MWAGVLPSSQDILPQVRSLFIEHVRARGHFPIVRIGREPYGILPVSWSARWKPFEGRTLDAPLAGLLLSRLRPIWRDSLKNVPCIAGPGDPEMALAGFLSMSPSSANFAFRGIIGPQYNTFYWRHLRNLDLDKTWWTDHTATTLIAAGDSMTAFTSSLAAKMTYLDWSKTLSDVLVAPAPLPGMSATSSSRQDGTRSERFSSR